MKYLAYIRQASQGCNYSIGCARNIIDIKAKNTEAANKKLSKIIIENYTDDT